MKLSIIIVNFNTKELLSDCLKLLLVHYKLYFTNRSFEVIVVDNASNDGSADYIKNNYPWVKLISLEKNVGFAKANNLGVHQSRGENVLFLNPDTLVPAQTLTVSLDYLTRANNIGIVTCKVLLASGKIDDACHRGFPTPWRAFTYFAGLGNLVPNSDFFNGYHLGYRNLESVHEIDACAGAYLMLKRKVGILVNWFDEDYFWYGDDLDLCFRVKEMGYKVLFVPQVSVTHYKGAASGIKIETAKITKADTETIRLVTKSRFEVMRIFYRKHYQSKYPNFVTVLVLFAIFIKQKLTESRL